MLAHEPSRAAECDGPHRGQARRGCLRALRGRRPAQLPGRRRREVSPGRHRRLRDGATGAELGDSPGFESHPSGSGGSGGRGTRARQAGAPGERGTTCVLPILLHGDAAFAGQGTAAETLNLANLDGYSVGGTVHVVVNNLIGFTANPAGLTPSRFASDVAKRLPIPIFHVNAEDPDAAVRVARAGGGVPLPIPQRRGGGPDRLPPPRPQRDR